MFGEDTQLHGEKVKINIETVIGGQTLYVEERRQGLRQQKRTPFRHRTPSKMRELQMQKTPRAFPKKPQHLRGLQMQKKNAT